ncbi:MAG: hypothetical protein PUC39_05080 [Lachnospiraceae bacterium]|nr:hypothetical protein [Lachnospiraceae bacterium]
MLTLNNYELILLDNLVYLGKIVEIKKEEHGKILVSKMVDDLLKGDIDNYWKDELKEDQSDDNPGQCLMKKEEMEKEGIWRTLIPNRRQPCMWIRLVLN